MCGCKCCIYAKSMHDYLLTWNNHRMKHLKDISNNAQNRRYGEISSCIFETYKNSVQPNGCHIYNTAVDMAMEKMCTCTSKHHRLPHFKYVLHCCDKHQSIVLPSQEEIKDITNTCLTIRFHVYRNFSHCTVHGRHPYHE